MDFEIVFESLWVTLGVPWARFWELWGCILEAKFFNFTCLGVSWAPFWELRGFIFGAKIVNFGILGGPWHPDGPEPEKEAKKEPQTSK